MLRRWKASAGFAGTRDRSMNRGRNLARIGSRDIERKDPVMARLRTAILAVALATGGAGCATFCDECDDFPLPGGPGGYAMLPGSYAGGPLSSA